MQPSVERQQCVSPARQNGSTELRRRDYFVNAQHARARETGELTRILRNIVIAGGALLLAGAGSDEMLPVLFGVTVILLGGKLGGEAVRWLGQPTVLGELGAGIVLGNLDVAGISWFEYIASNPHIEILAQFGVLLLLFEVGLESTVGQMLKTGVSSLLVAVIGVVAPLGAGWATAAALLPEATWHTHVFVGATLTATSVGITARVLRDLGRSTSTESRIILGAAVIDDVLGLVVLSVVVGAIAASNAGTSLTVTDGMLTLGQAGLFLFGAVAAGLWVVPRLFAFTARVNPSGMVLVVSLAFCFALSWGAGMIGLAPIIGAFAAGLVLEDVHFRGFHGKGQKELEELIHPLVSFLSPLFFVTMGMRTDVRAFGDGTVLLLSGALVAVAVVSKQAASLGVVGRGVDRLTVGLGMIPRGEVGLIFAATGAAATGSSGESVISPALFSALAVVVMLTTLVTPPLIKWSVARRKEGPQSGT
jgi:Kef-type K+ transport system membrane component KefB